MPSKSATQEEMDRYQQQVNQLKYSGGMVNDSQYRAIAQGIWGTDSPPPMAGGTVSGPGGTEIINNPGGGAPDPNLLPASMGGTYMNTPTGVGGGGYGAGIGGGIGGGGGGGGGAAGTGGGGGAGGGGSSRSTSMTAGSFGDGSIFRGGRAVSVTPNGPGGGSSDPSSGAGGAGGGGVDFNAILRMLGDQTAQANSANEARYQKLMDLADQYKNQSMQMQQGAYGAQQQAIAATTDRAMQRSGEQDTQNHAATQASAINRGLGNTTITDSLHRGVDRTTADRNLGIQTSALQATGQLNQQAYNDAQGIQNNWFSGLGSFIQNRTDKAPDMSAYLQLLMSPGALGGGTRPPGGVRTRTAAPFSG